MPDEQCPMRPGAYLDFIEALSWAQDKNVSEEVVLVFFYCLGAVIAGYAEDRPSPEWTADLFLQDVRKQLELFYQQFPPRPTCDETFRRLTLLEKTVADFRRDYSAKRDHNEDS